MCFPLVAAIGPLVGLASSIGSAAMGMANSQEQYSQETKQYAQNVSNAEMDARTDYVRENSSEMENNAQYAEKAQLGLIEGAEKQSSVAASAATGGVSGNVVTSIINGIGTAVGMKGAELNKQWAANGEQAEAEKAQSTNQENMRIGEMAQPIEPNPGGAIIGALGGGLKFAGELSGKNSFFGSSTGSAPNTSVSTPTVVDNQPSGSGGIGMM